MGGQSSRNAAPAPNESAVYPKLAAVLVRFAPMPFSPTQVALLPHPETGHGPVRGVSVRIARTAGGTLAATYVFDGDIDRVRVPAPHPRCVTDRLWEHTCCEMFIARDGTGAYHEFNFAPSGDWTAYAFERYRERASPDAPDGAIDAPPQVTPRRTPTRLAVDVLLRVDRLTAAYAGGTLALALAAVVEDRDGALSYWALAHPPGAPDFHHRDAFALTLDEVRD